MVVLITVGVLTLVGICLGARDGKKKFEETMKEFDWDKTLDEMNNALGKNEGLC